MFPLSEYVHKYSLAQDGTVTKLATGEAIVQSPSRHGPKVMLWSPKKEVYVHRLLAMQYIPNPEGHNIVLFRDEDTSNIDLSNLYWSNRTAVMTKIHQENPGINGKLDTGTKEKLLLRILAGEAVKVVAKSIKKSPENLVGILRPYAFNTNRKAKWQAVVHRRGWNNNA